VKGLWLLTRRNLSHHAGRTLILVACLALSVFVPAATQVLVQHYDHQLRARAEATPLVAGTEGQELDLTLEALYFREGDLDPMRWRDFERIRSQGMGLVVPLHATHHARGHSLLGTTPEYFELRGLTPASGTLPLMVGDVVLGARMADQLGLTVGDELFSDPVALYDISKPASFRMQVSGVLAERGERDDLAAFVDIKTAWVLDGLYHGHKAAGDIASENPDLIIGTEGDDQTGSMAISGALIEENVMDATTIDSFHFHGDQDELPLSSVLIWPTNHKDRTLLKARVNDWPGLQMVTPIDVIDELMAKVVRIKSLLDRLAVLLAGSTGLLIALVLALSLRLRKGELMTLDRIGCARGTVAQLVLLEILVVAAASLLVAVLATAATVTWAPHLVEMI
jgi:putative ABC transport system permease protein